MKVSELTVKDVAAYLKYDESDLLDTEIEKELTLFISAARSYVRSYTGLSDEEIDEYEDLTMAVLLLVSDFCDNRAAYLASGQVTPSKTLDSILGFHRKNLI